MQTENVMLLLAVVGWENEQLQKGNNINKLTVLFQQQK